MQVPEGKLIGIIGPNGAGKSTLIKAVLGLTPSASGTVSIYGKSSEKERKRIGYVPQRGSVDWDFPTSALDVVLMGRYGHIGWCRRPKNVILILLKPVWIRSVCLIMPKGRSASFREASSSGFFWPGLYVRMRIYTLWMNRLWELTPLRSGRLSRC